MKLLSAIVVLFCVGLFYILQFRHSPAHFDPFPITITDADVSPGEVTPKPVRFVTKDGLCFIHEQFFLANNTKHPLIIKGTVVIFHGWAEYSHRYREFIQTLQSEGFHVYIFDVRGHGRSSGQRAYWESFDPLYEDVQQILEERIVKYYELYQLKSRNLFLLCHSMGCLTTLSLDGQLSVNGRGGFAKLIQTKTPFHWSGMIVSGPAVTLAEDMMNSPIQRVLLNVLMELRNLLPSLPIETPPPATLLSKDQLENEDYASDEKIYHGKFLVGWGASVIEKQLQLQSQKLLQHLTAPSLLVIQGALDKHVNPKGAQEVHDLAPCKDKKVNIYKNMYHELFHEPERKQVFETIINWMTERI